MFGLGYNLLDGFIALLKGERCDNLLVFTLLLVDSGAFYYCIQRVKFLAQEF